jgi:hypothetical protein
MERKPGRREPIALRDYQEECVAALTASALDTIAKIRGVPANRQRISREQGYALLEAPTASGKTVMLAATAEGISRAAPIVWFWFAPFAGVIDQTISTLHRAAPGLRGRIPALDRALEGTKPGDAFIATWASVAARRAESRRMRVDDDVAISLPALLNALRDSGFGIGVVVDEAHHSFRPNTEAFRFFQQELRPDIVMLATATPNDVDIEMLRRALEVVRFQRVSISRARVVKARLNKKAVQAVSFTARGVGAKLVDMNDVALRAAVQQHRLLKKQLTDAGFRVTPLLLVQAASEGWTPARVRDHLERRLGFKAESIGVHTASEPDPDVQALARDPAMEVLIFKMAVATGFDAPRAFVLCALRAVTDAGFGLQVVGRIMRVHPLLQPHTDLPLTLDTGWVFLGDADGQTGLQSAAQRIQSIRDGIAVTTDSVHVVNVEADATGNIVVVDENGQHEFVLERDPDPPDEQATLVARTERAATLFTQVPSLFAALVGVAEPADDASPAPSSDSRNARPASRAMPTLFRYPRRASIVVPAALRTEKMPRDTKPLLAAIARAVRFTPQQLLAARQVTLPIERREEELFEGRMARRMAAQGVISDLFATQAAHKVLSVCDHIPVADLGRALMERLRSQLQEQGQEPLDEKALRRALHLILGQWPEITREALRRAMASCAEVIDAAPLPEFWESDEKLSDSPLNLYAVMPRGLNTWEQPFAEWLDQQEGTVLWWIRNLSRPNASDDWSVRIVLPEDGRGFYPDFVVCVDGRKSGIALAETKERMHSSNAEAKTRTEHREYGRALMLAYDEPRNRFYRYEYSFERGGNYETGMLRREDLLES